MFTLPIDEFELRLHEECHSETLFSLVDKNRDYLGPWLPFVVDTKSPEDTRAFIRSSRQGWADGRSLQTSIWLDGTMIGTIGLVNISRENQRAEIGYWIDEDHAGGGIITRATRALIEHSFNTLGLYRIEIRCEPTNLRSLAVPERLGMHFEGVTRGWAICGDRHVDHRVYSVLRDEWPRPCAVTPE